ncbi:MAG: hypothetical protein AAFN77_10780 [Planctomycetota bacterium]
MATRTDIRLAAHQKFATYITRNMRCVLMDEEVSKIHFRVYFQNEPTEYEKEIVSETAFEITTAIDHPLEATSACFVSSEPIRNLKGDGYWIFAIDDELGREF